MNIERRRAGVYLFVGAFAAVMIEAAWRHDYARILLRATPDALVDGGMHDFYNSATVEDGLGPVFNTTSCGTCHYLPETGPRAFDATGCAACHRAAVGGVRAYSDFLRHDVGTGDGTAQGDATADEIRTAPLWGLRTRRLLLHDRSALTPSAAIAAHRGEAEGVRRRFDALDETRRQALLAS